MLLAKETHTGIDFWVSLSIRELNAWIVEYNLLLAEEKARQGKG